MRLGILSPAFPPFPCAESDYVFRLACGLRERGAHVTVATSVVTARRTSSFSVVPARGTLSLVRDLMNAEIESLLVPFQPWLFREVPFYRRAIRLYHFLKPSVPLTLLIYNPEPLLNKHSSWHALLPSFSRIVLLSERHRLKFCQKFPSLRQRAFVIAPFSLAPVRPPFSKDQAREKLALGSDEFWWVSLGFLFPGKGIETLLKAFGPLAKKQPQARLAIIGGEMSQSYSSWTDFARWLRHIATSLGVSDKIRWVGGFDGDKGFPQDWLTASDSAVLPFDVGIGTNNSSVATITGFSLPIVSTRGQFLDPEFWEEKNCLLVPPHDSAALGLAMNRTMTDAELREQLAQGSRLLSAQTFDSRTNFDYWHQFLHRPKPVVPAARNQWVPRYT